VPVKRYNPILEDEGDYQYIGREESTDGTYVLYEDYVAIREALEEMVAQADFPISELQNNSNDEAADGLLVAREKAEKILGEQ